MHTAAAGIVHDPDSPSRSQAYLAEAIPITGLNSTNAATSADVEKEHAVDATECCRGTVSVVEIPDGDLDAIGEELGARRVADERADFVAPPRAAVLRGAGQCCQWLQ